VNKKVVILIVVLLTLLLVTQAFADNIGIDDFNSDSQNVCIPASACTSGVSASSISYAGSMGNERDVVITRSSGILETVFTSGLAGDFMRYSNDPSVFGTLELVWDGADGDPNTIDFTGLGGLDVTTGSTNDMRIFLYSTDQTFDLYIQVWTDSGNWSDFTQTMTPADNGTSFEIPYASFVAQAGTGADFANLGAIRFFIDATAINGLDLILDYATFDDDTPTAVSLQDISASDSGTLLPFALGAFGLIVVSTGLVISRKRKNAA
jgi:hypothetical protein